MFNNLWDRNFPMLESDRIDVEKVDKQQVLETVRRGQSNMWGFI